MVFLLYMGNHFLMMTHGIARKINALQDKVFVYDGKFTYEKLLKDINFKVDENGSSMVRNKYQADFIATEIPFLEGQLSIGPGVGRDSRKYYIPSGFKCKVSKGFTENVIVYHDADSIEFIN